MASYVWETKEVEKLMAKREVTVDENGQPFTDGKKHFARVNKKVNLVHPKINPKVVTTADALTSAVNEIIAEQRQGYRDIASVIECLNFGLYRLPSSRLNSGQDAALTKEQQALITNFKNVLAVPTFTAEVRAGMAQTFVQQLREIGVDEPEMRLGLTEPDGDSSSSSDSDSEETPDSEPEEGSQDDSEPEAEGMAAVGVVTRRRAR